MCGLIALVIGGAVALFVQLVGPAPVPMGVVSTSLAWAVILAISCTRALLDWNGALAPRDWNGGVMLMTTAVPAGLASSGALMLWPDWTLWIGLWILLSLSAVLGVSVAWARTGVLWSRPCRATATALVILGAVSIAGPILLGLGPGDRAPLCLPPHTLHEQRASQDIAGHVFWEARLAATEDAAERTAGCLDLKLLPVPDHVDLGWSTPPTRHWAWSRGDILTQDGGCWRRVAWWEGSGAMTVRRECSWL